jgi:hypothetical protein
MSLEPAKLTDVSHSDKDPARKQVKVRFNPTDMSLERGSRFASMSVPGLSMPILQYIRGDSDMLHVELFLDRTDEGNDVDADINALEGFIQIDSSLHAPPVVLFEWGSFSFTGVVKSLREKMTLFSEDGRRLRARIALTFKSYKSAEVQLRELNLSSPDRSHARVLREGETLAHIAYEAYGDPRMWRPIALANGIERPRFIPPGTPLWIPSI